ncbi:MAG TPA: hypothetical protein VIC35_11630 [Acidimicrobiia bacterium]
MTEATVTDSSDQSMSDAKVREERRAVYRGMIQHENDLRNQRLGWLFALNGFLFAAAGVVWSTSNPKPLLVVIAITGAVTSLSCGVALWFGTKGIRGLNNLAESERQAGDLPVAGMRTEWFTKRKLPRPVNWAMHAVYPWNLVPVVLAGAWVAIAFVGPGHL